MSAKSSAAEVAVEAAWIERIGIIEAEARSAISSLPVTMRLTHGKDLIEAVSKVVDEQVARDANRLAMEGHSLYSIATIMDVSVDVLRRHVRRADPSFTPYRTSHRKNPEYVDLTHLWSST